MSLIAVAIGNTTTALAAFDGSSDAGWPAPISAVSIPTLDLLAGATGESALAGIVASGEPGEWRVASVHRAAERAFAETIAARRPSDRYRALSYGDLPIEIDVEFPRRVGIDRLVAAVAANALAPGRPKIVIDAGTAVTVDLVDAGGVFRGGAILPGLALASRALAEGTDALPVVGFDPQADPPPVVGRSTEAAIDSGLFWGTLGAVREIVSRVRTSLSEPPQLLVTGGDARRMTPLLDAEARYEPHLVVGGIALAVA